MTDDEWKEAWRLFELASGLGPDARRSLIADTPPHIVDEVEAMIEAAEDAELEEPVRARDERLPRRETLGARPPR